MILTFIILAITIFLFIWGKIRPDLVAVLSVLALFLAGIIDTGQALTGFSNSTVIMIAALFVVAEGLSRTGVTAWLGQQLLNQAGSSKTRLLVVVMVGTAVLSAFLSNTGTVAMLLPAVVAAAWSVGGVPSQFLIPLAFAANIGGLLTLIGTAPNIIVTETLADAGLRPFGFFEFSLIGLPLLLATVGYMVFIGRSLLPKRAAGERPIDLAAELGEMSELYSLPGNLSQLRVRRNSNLVGQTLEQAALGRDYNVSVLEINRATAKPLAVPQPIRNQIRNQLEKLLLEDDVPLPGPDTMIEVNDVLLVKGTKDAIQRVAVDLNLGVQPVTDTDEELPEGLLSQEIGLAEVLISARSEYIGQTVAEGQFANKFNVQVLSIRRQDKLVDRQSVKLAFGDSLLIRGTWEDINRLQKESRNFVVVGRPEAMARQVVGLSPRAAVAISALVIMVALMVTGLVPTVMATIIAAVIVTLGGCLTTKDAYASISWETVVLIAAMLPMSTALEVTGGAELIADALVNTLGTLHPLALMAGVFLLTTAFSQVISNTATTVLVAPIVLQAALELDVSPHAMLMMVAIGASAAFLTPIASPPNTLVMNPGGYRFNDYFKTGLPLMIIFLLVSLVLVPLIWPL